MFNVILPTYNEAESILVLIRMLQRVFADMGTEYKLIIVDDNSPDNTSGLVKALGDPSVVVLDRPGKMGLGSAYVDALSRCSFPYTVIMDTDLQHNPFDIKRMYKGMLEGYGIVTGTRYSLDGKITYIPVHRRVISAGANNLARYVLGLQTQDLTGSFRMYRTDLLKRIARQVKCKGFGFQMEVIAIAESKGILIKECPITFYERRLGESKISPLEMFRFLTTTAFLYFSL